VFCWCGANTYLGSLRSIDKGNKVFNLEADKMQTWLDISSNFVCFFPFLLLQMFLSSWKWLQRKVSEVMDQLLWVGMQVLHLWTSLKWPVSTFSLQYHCITKHRGHENEGNGHQRRNVLIFKQILPTCTMRYMEFIEENMHIDIGAWRVCILYICWLTLHQSHRKKPKLYSTESLIDKSWLDFIANLQTSWNLA